MFDCRFDCNMIRTSSRDCHFDSNMIRTSSRFGDWICALAGAYHPLGNHSDASRAYLHCVCALLWIVGSSMVESIASLGSRSALGRSLPPSR